MTTCCSGYGFLLVSSVLRRHSLSALLPMFSKHRTGKHSTSDCLMRTAIVWRSTTCQRDEFASCVCARKLLDGGLSPCCRSWRSEVVPVFDAENRSPFSPVAALQISQCESLCELHWYLKLVCFWNKIYFEFDKISWMCVQHVSRNLVVQQQWRQIHTYNQIAVHVLDIWPSTSSLWL